MRQTIAVVLSLWLAVGNAAAQSPGEAAAREHFRQGVALYQQGKYAEAIAKYRQALQLVPSPEFLFNLAQAYRLKGDKKQAYEHYKKYVELEPNGRGAKEARVYMASLSLEIAEEEERNPPPAAVQVQPEQRPPSVYTPGGYNPSTPSTYTPGGYSAYSPSINSLMYNKEKVSVCVEDARDYKFCDWRNRSLSENDFIRKYHRVTGSSALDQYIETPANKIGLITVGALSITFLALMIGGSAGIAHSCFHNEGSPPRAVLGVCNLGADITFASIGGAGLFFTTLIGWPLAVKQPTWHHRLKKGDAQKFVDYYNESLANPGARRPQREE